MSCSIYYILWVHACILCKALVIQLKKTLTKVEMVKYPSIWRSQIKEEEERLGCCRPHDSVVAVSEWKAKKRTRLKAPEFN